MAEFVQQSIEEMLPELEQMKRVELFTEKETQTILRKRKAYEYKLRRRTKQKADYLQYIQYEVNLLALLKKRRHSSGYQYKQLEIDVPIINRIHKLFKMGCWRFQQDVSLWLCHIDFCKRRKEKAPVSNMFVKMLQIHSKKPALWVSAAEWEMDSVLSMENSRGLLQRGLRFNPTSEQLWREYFRMELLNAEKLRKRREILGLAALEKEEANVSDSVLEGMVALVVFKKAIEAISGKVEFCLSFLPICRLFDFTRHIEEEIFTCLQVWYVGEELSWEAMALQHLYHSPHHNKQLSKQQQKKLRWESDLRVAEVFTTAVKEVNTEKMWSLYIKFCKSQMEKKSSRALRDKRTHLLLSVYQRAADEDKLSPDLYTTWVETLCDVGAVSDVERVLHQGLTHHPHSLTLWTSKLHTDMTGDRTTDLVKVSIEQALDKVNDKESYPLWELSLCWAKQHCTAYMETLLERGIMKCAEISVKLKRSYLDWAILSHNISHVRELFTRLSASKPLSVEFFETYINIERSQEKPKMKRIRLGYEDAIREYGTSNTDLWLEYIKLEMSHPRGKPQEAGEIYWRALKTLDGSLTEKFVTVYTLLQTGHL